MAIDSAEKRRAAANLHHRVGPGVTPNASKDAEWRTQVGYGYSGIAAGPPAPATGVAGLSKMSLGIRVGI